MGLLDCVASPEERDEFDENRKPISRNRPRALSRSDHDISRRRSLPIFASQSSLKNIRDIDFWRQKVLRFLFSPEGREDVRLLRIPFNQLGYTTVTEFISAIPPESFQEYLGQASPDEGILKDDKIFWLRDGVAEPGTFKWQGIIENEPCIGLQLDRKKAVPFGTHDGRGLFYCKPGHRALVPEHEVIPYKKFLRKYLGLPPKKDSLMGTEGVRLSAKAIAAKNSKPGDRVYLPKEKKWATVQWIGKIENETVVDLVYEPAKPDAGKPVSPDEPTMSRSMSMADFIEELAASEPNSPVDIQAKESTHLTSPIATSTPNKPLEITPAKVESFPVSSPGSPPLDTESEDDSQETDTSDESDSEEEIDSEDVSEDESASEEEWTSKPVEPKILEKPVDVPKALETFQEQKRNSNNNSETLGESSHLSPKLSSPKRKGFFAFSPKNKKRASLYKAEAKAENIHLVDEPVKTPPPTHSKSPGLFSKFKVASRLKNDKSKSKEELSQKSKSKEVLFNNSKSKEELSNYKTLPPVEKKKKTEKFVWTGLFKSRSKGSLHKLAINEPTSPRALDCSTPIDEMIPPEKIPTPPPNDSFNERRVDRPEFPLSTPIDNESIDELIETAPLPPENGLSEEERKSNSSESESEEEVEATPKHVDTPVELHTEPPSPMKRSVKNAELTTSTVEATLLKGPMSTKIEHGTLGSEERASSTDPPEAPVSSLDKLKETKVRNRPTSFSSFLSKLKNQKGKSDGSPQIPVSSVAPTTPDSNDGENIQVENKTESNEDSKIIKENNSVISDSDVSSLLPHMETNETGSNEAIFQSNRNLTKPENQFPSLNESVEGNQEEINLESLDLQENQAPKSPSSVASPRRKSRSRPSYSFSFSKKRKTSRPETPNTPTTPDSHSHVLSMISTDTINIENTEFEGQTVTQPVGQPQSPNLASDKEKKTSKSSSFRESFKRTFSLSRNTKQQDTPDEDDEVKSPTSNISKPRPVTLYFDNNEVAESRKNSFRKKRPASLVVDIKPWGSRHGRGAVDIYSSESSVEGSPPIRTPNSALTPKQEGTNEIPKHRIFTTPTSFFARKNKKVVDKPSPVVPSVSNSLYKKYNQVESDSDAQTPGSGVTSAQTEKSAPPPLPSAPPPSLKYQPSFTLPSNTSSEDNTQKLKSALKQRKEIDAIPRGLKINDRVLWYSGNRPIPGTVQRLFKDGTDKYTAMVKFDRIPDEPLRLTREGDAYIITVEELITPDMFRTTETSTPADTTQEVLNQTPEIQSPPPTPSVRFDGVTEKEEVPQVLVTQASAQEDEEEYDLPPPFQEEEVNMACGFKRGIQARDKSCCLEAILFSLFYTTNAFDITILYCNTPSEDAVTQNVRRILRRDIVDALRREGLCKWEAVNKLRDAVKPLSNEWQTLSTDAEVMVFILFDRALKLEKFINYSNDMSDYLHQLVVDPKDLSKSTTVQHLLETSLELMDRLKFKTIPTPALILEMPRSNDKLMQYKAVIPNISLVISHLLEEGPRLCICGVVAAFECRRCTEVAGSMSIVYCNQCKPTCDNIHRQLTHEVQLSPLNQSVILLDLVGLICVKNGTYSSFVKCGQQKMSPWVYYDASEHDNPKVCIEQNLGMWLDRLEKFPGRYTDALQYPLLSHILEDCHICVYEPREKTSSV